MTAAMFEHTNFTVSDPKATAAWMCDLFGWHIRWEGEALNGGYTVHVGNDEQYLAVYAPANPSQPPKDNNYATIGGLNHLAVVVKDIKAMENAVVSAGFTPEKHGDYEPGKRFYFYDHDGIEYEVVAYD